MGILDVVIPQKRKIRRAVFKTILTKSKVYHSPHLTLRAHKKESCEEEPSVFSFVVSRKVSNKSTKRNLLKRRGYAAVRGIIKKTKPCFTCVFYVKKNALELKYSELEKEIVVLLEKAGVI